MTRTAAADLDAKYLVSYQVGLGGVSADSAKHLLGLASKAANTSRTPGVNARLPARMGADSAAKAAHQELSTSGLVTVSRGRPATVV